MPANEDRNAHPDADYFRAHHPSRVDLPADPPDAHDDGALADDIFGLDTAHAAQLRAIDAEIARVEDKRRSRRSLISRIRRHPA